jgi:hypothetical protein
MQGLLVLGREPARWIWQHGPADWQHRAWIFVALAIALQAIVGLAALQVMKRALPAGRTTTTSSPSRTSPTNPWSAHAGRASPSISTVSGSSATTTPRRSFSTASSRLRRLFCDRLADLQHLVQVGSGNALLGRDWRRSPFASKTQSNPRRSARWRRCLHR